MAAGRLSRPTPTRLLVFQRNVWLESLTQVYMPRTHKLGPADARTTSTEIDVVANSSPPGADAALAVLVGRRLQPLPVGSAEPLRDPRLPCRSAASSVAQFTILRLVSDTPATRLPGLDHARDAGRDSLLFGQLIQRS